jgi:uncharacterized protein YceK
MSWCRRTILLNPHFVATVHAFLLTGCATFATLSSDRVEGTMFEDRALPRSLPRVYSGLLTDLHCLGALFGEGQGGQIGFWCILDVPLSLAADTLILPYTGYEQLRFGSFRPRLVPEVHEAAERHREEQRHWYVEGCRRVLARADSGPYVEQCKRDLSSESDTNALPARSPDELPSDGGPGSFRP